MQIGDSASTSVVLGEHDHKDCDDAGRTTRCGERGARGHQRPAGERDTGRYGHACPWREGRAVAGDHIAMTLGHASDECVDLVSTCQRAADLRVVCEE